MDDSSETTQVNNLLEYVTAGETRKAIACLDRVETMPASRRKEILRVLQSFADDEPTALSPLTATLARFLTDDKRAIRLLSAKILVALATADPSTVESITPSLAERLADEDELYYVRARAAEALGYIALEHPDAVASPETLAELRLGLSFDEPEVREKLAKALEYIALGEPSRLTHLVGSLVEHLDDENELVRYHLCTALVIIACEAPENLETVTQELTARLEDENPYVRGRAAEAFGVLQRAVTEVSRPEEVLGELTSDETAFVAERARFAIEMPDGHGNAAPTDLGTIPGVLATTDEAVAGITSSDSDRQCPHCGLQHDSGEPSICPRCGNPS